MQPYIRDLMNAALKFDQLVQHYTDAKPANNNMKVDNPYWISFWTIFTIIIVGSGIPVRLFLQISSEGYQIVGYSALIAMTICFFVAKKLIPGGYSVSKQAICHMGRMRTKKGENNLKAAFLFAVFFSIEAILIIFLGNLLAVHAKEDLVFAIISYLCYFSAISCVLTGIVPIDLYERLHLFAAFVYLISTNIWLVTLMSLLWMVGKASLLMQIEVILVSITAVLYFWGYFTNFRYTAMFQKFWIMFVTLAFVICIQYFSAY